MSESIPRPGVLFGDYPYKDEPERSNLAQWVHQSKGAFVQHSNRPLRHARRFLHQVNTAASSMPPVGSPEFENMTERLRANLQQKGIKEELAAEAFALIRALAALHLGLRHYDVQMIAGWALMQGYLAEMETGEGKTLTAALPACVAALAGIPVHVVTANEYLVTRDAQSLVPLYHSLGLTTGQVIESQSSGQRRQGYACDITYCTGKQLVFDYLRDRTLQGAKHDRLSVQLQRYLGGEKPLLRGLCFTIVDEADSVLIDDALTPLILSQEEPSEVDVEKLTQALTIAAKLKVGEDYELHEKDKEVSISQAGARAIDKACDEIDGFWTDPRGQKGWIQRALAALYLFRRDRDYLVRSQKVEIIDSNTGRVMPNHHWEQGLHQLIEIKEGVPLSPSQRAIARTSYQRFFNRYYHLCGMTGTAAEAKKELWAVYGLRVVKIPTHRPSRRKEHIGAIYPSEDKKWKAVTKQVQHYHQQGRPVLVGTGSVESSEQLSKELSACALIHRVLNARQDRQEAEIIAQAGKPGAITVATNMAGRGTDIRLGEGVAKLGGLHVLACEYGLSSRLDRQLAGRCGRQGDPGSFQVVASVTDTIVKLFFPLPIYRKILFWARMPYAFRRKMIRLFQFLLDRTQCKKRKILMRYEEEVASKLSFFGKGE